MHEDPFEVLRRLAGDPVPTDADRLRALTRLEHAIGTDRAPVRFRWLTPVAAAVAVVVIAVGVMLVTRPTAVEAALGEIATAARLATPQEIPTGSFLYTRTEETSLGIPEQGDLIGIEGPVAYLLPMTRQEWDNGDFQQLTITTYAPIFFDPAVEAAYYAHGWDRRDGVGETVTRQLTGITNDLATTNWPTNPDDLKEALDDYTSQSGSDLPLDIQVFHLATDLLRATNPTPALRSALIEVLAQLPVTLANQTPDGTVTLTITYNQPPATRDTITLDDQGHLIAETSTILQAADGVPANTNTYQATHTIPTIVDTLDPPTP
jgi:hypothetical protein